MAPLSLRQARDLASWQKSLRVHSTPEATAAPSRGFFDRGISGGRDRRETIILNGLYHMSRDPELARQALSSAFQNSGYFGAEGSHFQEHHADALARRLSEHPQLYDLLKRHVAPTMLRQTGWWGKLGSFVRRKPHETVGSLIEERSPAITRVFLKNLHSTVEGSKLINEVLQESARAPGQAPASTPPSALPHASEDSLAEGAHEDALADSAAPALAGQGGKPKAEPKPLKWGKLFYRGYGHQLQHVDARLHNQRITEMVLGAHEFVQSIAPGVGTSKEHMDALFSAAQTSESYHEFLDKLSRLGTIPHSPVEHIGHLYSDQLHDRDFHLGTFHLDPGYTEAQRNAIHFWQLSHHVWGKSGEGVRRRIRDSMRQDAKSLLRTFSLDLRGKTEGGE